MRRVIRRWLVAYCMVDTPRDGVADARIFYSDHPTEVVDPANAGQLCAFFGLTRDAYEICHTRSVVKDMWVTDFKIAKGEDPIYRFVVMRLKDADRNRLPKIPPDLNWVERGDWRQKHRKVSGGSLFSE